MRIEFKDNQIRPLIGSPSPRDIQDVAFAYADISDDKAYAKYYDEYTAYKVIRDFFLKYKKYTHLVIWPDDLVVSKADYWKLRKQVEENDYPILSGTANFNFNEKDKSITCRELPTIDYEVVETDGKESWTSIKSNYKFLTMKDLDDYKDNPVQRFAFDGFACTFIRRDIVEKIPFRGYNKLGKERAFDFTFAEDCAKLNIPMMVDTSVRSLHLSERMGRNNGEAWGVGIKEPICIYETTTGPMNRNDKAIEKMIASIDINTG